MHGGLSSFLSHKQHQLLLHSRKETHDQTKEENKTWLGRPSYTSMHHIWRSTFNFTDQTVINWFFGINVRGNKRCRQLRKSYSKILGSHSLSFPSEPPDIGIWFPSYQYKSPEVDLSDNDIEKDVDFDIFKDNKGRCVSDFGKPFSDESAKIERFDKGADQEHPVNKFQDNNLDEITELPASLKKLFSRKEGDEEHSDGAYLRKDDLISSERDDKLRENNGNSPRKSFTGRNCVKGQSDKRCLKKEDIISSKNNENHRENSDSSLKKLLSRRGEEDCKQFEGKISRKLETFTSENYECLRENKEKSPDDSMSWRDTKKSRVKEENSEKKEVSVKPLRETEKEGKFTGNFDFISMKNNENLLRNSDSVLSENNGKSYQLRTERVQRTIGDESFQVSRRALSEITNSDFPSVSLPERAGKWKCPRRSKPDLGPSMKQLRLERWVRRV